MDNREALNQLKKELEEIPKLSELYDDNQDFKLWRSRVETIIKYGLDGDDYNTFKSVQPLDFLDDLGIENLEQSVDYPKILKDYETAIKKILQKYEILGIEEKPSNVIFPSPGLKYQTREFKNEPVGLEVEYIDIFDAMQFHPRVIEASRSLFESGHYAQAIFEAYKAVENFVKRKSKSNLYGKNLMSTVFNEEKPIIQVPDAGEFDKDVQEGFKFLFMGASLGIRNPKAHKIINQNDPYITLEYLGFASFLLKRIDYWEAGAT